jgi:hypothetical protein
MRFGFINPDGSYDWRTIKTLDPDQRQLIEGSGKFLDAVQIAKAADPLGQQIAAGQRPGAIDTFLGGGNFGDSLSGAEIRRRDAVLKQNRQQGLPVAPGTINPGVPHVPPVFGAEGTEVVLQRTPDFNPPGLPTNRGGFMGLLDSLGSLFGQAIDAAPAILNIINNQQDLEIQRRAAKQAIRNPIPQNVPRQRTFGGGQYQGGGFMPAPFVNAGGYQNAALSLDVPFVDITPQGSSRAFSPWVPTMMGARAQPFMSNNPVSGALTWFKPAGKPILWSGDLTACKRVERVARRAKRSRGRR